MDKKSIISILFLLFNILTFVYAQGEIAQDPDPKEPQPTPTPTTTSSTPAQTTPISTTPIANVLPQPTPSTTTTQPIINPTFPFNNSPGGIIQNNPIPNNPVDIPEQPLPPQTILDDHNLILTTNTTTLPITQPIAPKTTTVQKKATVVKTYPQDTFEPIDSTNNETPLGYVGMLYVMSAFISTLLAVYASYIVIKKGLGDNNANSTINWQANYDDESFRNKSTIARGTLTTSIRSTTTLSSPNTQPSNPSKSNQRYI